MAYEQKLQPRHLERLAVVYVRQSTVRSGPAAPRVDLTCSTGWSSRAERLGWPRPRILVIDDDLGVSGASAEGRRGFQRLLGEVALDHVGLILGVEMSRLARSCKDWYQLLELCAIFGTLICDLDGLYDPSHYNDRLLLGLKGTMSRGRAAHPPAADAARGLQKARGGELHGRLPIGYVPDADGGVIIDPDQQVQTAVQSVFELFGALGQRRRSLCAHCAGKAS